MRERRQVTGRPSSGGFGYQPALDGVRALAVAMVLVFHGGFGWMSGGYVGVSVFFTLSGYLITSLALIEHDATGRFSARAFYQRRIRRLLPASLVCLSGVIAAARVGWFEPAVHLRRDLWAAVTQVYNWSALAGDETYAEIVAGGGARARPLDHYWSLAIEEQFYWVWPLLLLVILRWSGRVRLAAIGGLTAATGVAAPLIAAAWGGDAAYWATPARLAEILVGATLAVILHRRPVSGSRGVGLLAPIGVVAIVGAGVTWPADSGPAYTGWLPVFALASGALIVGLQVAGPVRRVLSWRPLVALGAVSYGVYLYHWPIFGLLDERVLDWGRVPLFALRVVVTIAVAAASYLLAERPIRRGRRPVVTVFRPALAGCAAVAIAVVAAPVAVPQYAVLEQGSTGELAAVSSLPELAVVTAAPPSTATAPATTVEITAPPTTVTTPATSTAAAAAVETAPATTVSPTTTTTPPSTAPTLPEVPALPTDLTRPVRIVVAGDSTASALGGGMQVWAAYHPDVAQVEVRWAPGCGMLRRGFAPAGVIEPNCSNMHAALAADLPSIQPDVVVVMVTLGDIFDRVFDEAVGPISPDDPRFEAELRAGYEDELTVLQAAGVGHVAWMIAPPPEVYWQGDMARMIEPPRFRVLRRVIEELAAAHPDIVRAVDLTAWPAAMEHGARPDGLHFSFEVAAALSETYVGPIVVSVAVS